MNWQALLDPAIQKFIRDHEKADVAALALKKSPVADWPYPAILAQIKARQKAARKMPAWLDVDDIIFPPPDLVEQASSLPCALYKASLVQEGERFADLTGGTGMDSFALAAKFKSGTIIEHNPEASQLLAHNASALGLGEKLDVRNMPAEAYCKTLPEIDLVFIDPQRRNEKQRGIFDLSACTPDIIALLPALKETAKTVMIKTSPVLDIQKTIADLGYVKEVHIIQYDGDCKELLFILGFDQIIPPDDVEIIAVELDSSGAPLKRLAFTAAEENTNSCAIAAPMIGDYLYEPGPAFQKSGAYKTIAHRFALQKLHPNTHLYTGKTLQTDFPGRIFSITNICGAHKKELQAILPDMKASLTIRNFPMHPDDLRKKLGLKDGGAVTIFACEAIEAGKILLCCIKNV